MPTELIPTPLPFDPTGTAVSNKIVGEQQILTGANGADFYFFVPELGPYFADSLVINFTDAVTGESRELVEGIDYVPTHWYISASRACAKPIFGSISVLDRQLAGVARLTYQSLGGIWTISETEIAEILADSIHNPRITAWDVVVNKPISFPPIDHEWDLVDLVGMKDILPQLQAIEQAIIVRANNPFTQHLFANNPHNITPAKIGTYTSAQIDGMLAGLDFSSVIDAHVEAADPHQQYVLKSAIGDFLTGTRWQLVRVGAGPDYPTTIDIDYTKGNCAVLALTNGAGYTPAIRFINVPTTGTGPRPQFSFLVSAQVDNCSLVWPAEIDTWVDAIPSYERGHMRYFHITLDDDLVHWTGNSIDLVDHTHDMATAAKAGFVQLATVAETKGGIEATKATTPATVKAAIDQAISSLLNGVDPALDTLKELAAALGNDASFATNIATALSTKAAKDGSNVTANSTWNINVTGNAGSATTAGSASLAGKLTALSGPASYKLAYAADGIRANAGDWGRVVMHYDGNGQTYGVRVDRADYSNALINSDGTAWGTFDANGNFLFNKDVGSLSDRTLKTDWKVLENSLEMTLQLEGATYVRTDTGAFTMGLSAQDLQKTGLPVVGEQNGKLTVAYGPLAALFVENDKALYRLLLAQAERIELLETRLNELADLRGA